MRALSYFCRKFIVVQLAAAMAMSSPAHGSDVSKLLKLPSESKVVQNPSVFVYGDYSMDNLIPIRVLGAVHKAGIHYVPYNTDLLTLISLAGGTTTKASIDEITIKRNAKGKVSVLSTNLEELVSTPGPESPNLMPNDTVHIPQKTTFISEELLRTVGFIAALATIFGTVVIGVDRLK